MIDATIALPPILGIARLRLRAGDVLVVSLKGRPTAEQGEHINRVVRAELERAGVHDVGLLVTDSSIEMAIVDKGRSPPESDE